MSDDPTMPPAGWYPVDGGQERWWDGSAWSEHIRDGGAQGSASAAAVTPYQPPGKASRREKKLAQAVQNVTAVPVVEQVLAGGTLWSAVGKPLTGIGAGRYRLDERYLYYEEGTLRTDSQQLPVLDITDVDVKQSMSQKARGVYTVLVHAGYQMVRLEDIDDGRAAQQAINDAALAARAERHRRDTTVRYEGTSPHAAQVTVLQATTPTAPAANTASGPSPDTDDGTDFLAKLTQLAQLHERGALTDDEFTAAKARLLS